MNTHQNNTVFIYINTEHYLQLGEDFYKIN